MIEVYKQLGETPLQCLNRLRLEQPNLRDEILSYAGRLDPMASGLMRVLVGREENQKRQLYLQVNKRYRLVGLLGFQTDSDDILGLVEKTEVVEYQRDAWHAAFTHFSEYDQLPHFYSSPRLSARAHGKPDTPKARPVSTQLLTLAAKAHRQSTDATMSEIKNRLNRLTVDGFRTDLIIQTWEETLRDFPTEISLFEATLEVSSGCYIRQLMRDVGEYLGIQTCVYELERTAYGELE